MLAMMFEDLCPLHLVYIYSNSMYYIYCVHAICINSVIYLSSFQLSEHCFAELLPAFLLHQHLSHAEAVNIPLDQVEPAEPGNTSHYYPHTQQPIYQ